MKRKTLLKNNGSIFEPYLIDFIMRNILKGSFK